MVSICVFSVSFRPHHLICTFVGTIFLRVCRHLPFLLACLAMTIRSSTVLRINSLSPRPLWSPPRVLAIDSLANQALSTATSLSRHKMKVRTRMDAWCATQEVCQTKTAADPTSDPNAVFLSTKQGAFSQPRPKPPFSVPPTSNARFLRSDNSFSLLCADACR